LHGKTRKHPALLCNKACFSIGHRAFTDMPRVNKAQMDEELEATSFPVTKAGNPSRAKNPKYNFASVGPLSVGSRIALASMYNPNLYNRSYRVPGTLGLYSPLGKPPGFNALTGNRYRRDKPGTTGQAAFWQWVFESAQRMINARHSSGGYFRLCADVVRKVFGPAISKSGTVSSAAMTGLEAIAGGGNVSKRIGVIAGGTVATREGPVARASFWVSGTEADTVKNALVRVAKPVWERAIDAEAAGIAAYAGRLYEQSARESGIWVK